MINENKSSKLKVSNLAIFMIAIGATFFFIFDTSVYIPPGYVGIFINKISGQVLETPLHSGYHLKLPFFQQIVEYPFYMQTIILTKSPNEGSVNNDEINVNSVEGQPVSCDISLSYTLIPEKVPFLYTSFRQEIEQISHGFIKQTIRQTMQEVVGKTNIADFLGKDKAKTVFTIEESLQKRLKQYGFDIQQFTINEIRPPQTVIDAISEKNIMDQEALMAQNKLAKVKFEAMQRVEEAKGRSIGVLTVAKAQSKSNLILSQSITEELIKYKAIEKWDGNLPSITTKDHTESPLLNLRLPEKSKVEGK